MWQRSSLPFLPVVIDNNFSLCFFFNNRDVSVLHVTMDPSAILLHTKRPAFNRNHYTILVSCSTPPCSYSSCSSCSCSLFLSVSSVNSSPIEIDDVNVQRLLIQRPDVVSIFIHFLSCFSRSAYSSSSGICFSRVTNISLR